MSEHHSGRRITTRMYLGAAVLCTDAVTGRAPSTPITVIWVDGGKRFRRTPSGHFVVTDLPADLAELTVDIRGGGRYLNSSVTIDKFGTISNPIDSSYEAAEVLLYPAPSYPFDRGATLVRGSINANGEPVEAAECWIEMTGDNPPTFEAEGRSDPRGEYVLPVRGIGPADVTQAYQDGTAVDGRKLVHVDGGQPTVVVKHPDTGEIREQSVVVPEGDTVQLDFSFSL